MDRELIVTPLLLNHQPHPSPNAWVKLLIYEPTEADTLATRGKMYAVLSLSSATDIDFTPIMELIIETLHQRYFDNTEGGILQTLEATLDAIHKQLLLAGQQDKRLSAGFSFDILMAVSWGTVLYLGQLGSSRACLVRQEKLYDIDEGEQKSTSSYLSSGVVQAGDRFLLATNQLLKKFNRKQILHHLSLGADTLAQSMEQQLNHNPNSLESGIILLVDIKQVPSVKDEALQIVNADAMAAQPRLGATVKNLSNAASKALAASKITTNRLWRWRLFGKLPGLPLAIIVLCIIVLIGSVFYTYTRPSTKPMSNLNSTVTQLQDTLNQAQQVTSINPDRAADLLNQMEPTLSQALKTSQDKRLTNIANQRQHLQDQLLNIQTLSPHPIAQGSSAPANAKLTRYQDDLYFLSTKHQLIASRQASLQSLTTDTNTFSDAYLVATTDSLVVAQANQVSSINKSGQLKNQQGINLDRVVNAASYEQNAYVLAASGQVYRIVTQDQQLSKPSNYFSTAINPQGLIDLAIDGAVYILRQNGSVEKYLSGQKQAMVLERANLIQTPRAIFTDRYINNLYILLDHALLVWSKEGQYKGQLRLPESTKWQAAAVDGQHKKLYILTDGNLVEADLP